MGCLLAVHQSEASFDQYRPINIARDIRVQLGLLLRLERKMLFIIASFAGAIGIFMLMVPIAVQELVSTFSFAIEGRMIVTLSLMVATALIGVAAFRVLQARAIETLQQRLYTRIAIAFTETLPRLDEDSVLPEHANRFIEADLFTRALVGMLADLFNVGVVGSIFMAMLLFYHPYFLLYDVVLVAGFLFLLFVFGHGGFLITLEMSRLNYEILGWMQNIACNLPHLRAAGDTPYLMAKTDELTHAYVRVRQRRSDLLTGRQYKAAALWQVVGHTGMIATAGWLVSSGQLTIGQFAAAELIAGNLLLNLDTLARRMVMVFFAFVSCREMAGVFSLAKRDDDQKITVPLRGLERDGVKVTCRNISFHSSDGTPLFANFSLDVTPGGKITVLCRTNTAKTTLAKVLAGLYPPTTGVVRYNDTNLVEISMASICTCRGLVLDSQPTLLDGTLEDNITLGRRSISYQDIQWALGFVELDKEVGAMPAGLGTVITGGGKGFTLSQLLRVLVARAIVTRPLLLIFDGTLHSLLPSTRTVILRRLCAKEAPWSAIFTSNDAEFIDYADRRIILE